MSSLSQQAINLSTEQKRTLLADMIGRDTLSPGLYALSPAQQRLWFLEQLEPGTALYQINSGLRLTGDLDRDALRAAVATIVDRHETLRTAFVARDGEVFQTISSNCDLEVPAVDLRPLPDSVREKEAYEIARAESLRPFDLESSPLLRLKLIEMGHHDHILLFTMHHLVSDGWSIGVFIEELTELYESRTEGRVPLLAPISVQYSDFTRWQRESLAGEELDHQVQYWKTRLGGMPSRLELPTDRVRPAERSFTCGVVSVPLPVGIVEGLRALSQREDTTIFTALLAALNVLLFRYTNQEDICVGVPVAGRNQVETEGLIGLFVNTLVIRSDLSGNPRFRDLLVQVWETVLEAHSNQELPFERVVEEVQPRRSLTYNPLFQVMMTAVRDPLRVRRFGSLTANPYSVAVSTSSLDLTAFVIEGADGGLWWRLEYNTTMFDPARIQRMIGHYLKLLDSIVENPDRRIGDLDLMSAAEVEQFSTWNDNAASYPRACLHTLIAAQAARSPDAIAVVCEDGRLTYAELDRSARRVAAALCAAGARAGSRVAVCLERSLNLVPGVLGILKTGAAYVPIDPSQPVERVSLMVEDAGAELLLTQRSLVGRLSRCFRACVLIEDALTMAPAAPSEQHDPESLAYIMFTSGSTGRPKGVAVSHRAIANLLSSMQRQPGLAADDRFLAVTNLCFDISGLELFGPLVTGARSVIATKDAQADGSKLLDALRRESITMMQATPATWRLLIGAGWNRATCDLKVLCGGEALPADLANQLAARSDSVWNLYGPTETTVWSSLSRVGEHCPVTIGRPIQNTQFYVLDRRMRRVPVGIPGALYIGGAGVAAGYWDRSGLKSDGFVANPFNPSGGRLFKTGDEVRYRADGEIEYLGRLDSQVKVRGLRIELGEVETVVKQHPGIEQAVAVVREDVAGDQRLVCYAVSRRGTRIDPSDMRAGIRNKLPDYMVPTVVLLDSLPLTSNGKIDRARLPAPTENRRVSEKPRNTFEERLLPIWKQLLRLDEIGIKDNFFDLGGHSLLAMRLLAEVEKVFDRHLPLATIFAAQTVEQMAEVVSQSDMKPAASLVAIQKQGSGPPLFVVPFPEGNPLAYAELAKFLGSDQPVYVFQYVGLEGEGSPMESVGEIAEHFLAEIRKVQPRGPYRLAGFCMGGIIAFEMAQQLVARGEETPHLALVDTWHPSSIQPTHGAAAKARPIVFLTRASRRHFDTVVKLPARQVVRYVREKSALIKEMLFYRDVYRGDRRKRYEGLVNEANYRAASSYVPTPYPGAIHLFLAGDGYGETPADTRLAWCSLSSNCTVVPNAVAEVADFLRKPYVKVFAERLADWARKSGRQID
jgi:amino acid adenylation domain-containing protein